MSDHEDPPISDPVNVGTALDLIGRKWHGKPAPMACCPSCRVPLVSTFRFAGAEFYCIPCERGYGFLAPVAREATPELRAEQEAQRAAFDAKFSEAGTDE